MIRLLTASQAQELDQRTQKEFSITGESLMEVAGVHSAEIFEKFYPQKTTSIAVLCGPGNNGGDGLVMARELVRQGYTQLKIYLLFPSQNGSPLFKKQLLKLPAPHIVDISQNVNFAQCAGFDIYIDAIFGVGLAKDIEDPFASFLKSLNETKKIISLDIPSGLDASTGEPRGISVQALKTFTYGQPKAGCVIQQGPELCGQLVQIDIGFPKELRNEVAHSHFLIRPNDIKLPKRKALGNKTKYGHVKMWAGHEGMWGACILAARAAYRIGTGYVTLPENSLALEHLPEALSEKDAPFDEKFSYAAGPGWGVTDDNKNNLIQLYKSAVNKVVLDADALTLLAKHHLQVRPSWILTPHTGELSRLMDDVPSETIEKDRFAWALKAADKWNCIVLLKGFRSLVAQKGKVYVIPTGNAGLSKAGSGDVLTGMIAGLRAQGLHPLNATLCAAYLHGKLADEWARKNDLSGLTPSDLLVEIPQLIKKY